MSNVGFTPQTLKAILTILLLVSAGLGVMSFIYGQQLLQEYAIEVSHKQKDASASHSLINSLDATKQKLLTDADVRTKISQLRAQDEFPEFRIVNEVRSIAKNNGIGIKGFSYPDSTAVGTAPPSTPATPTPTTSNSGDGDTITLLVDLEQPVDTKAFLQFIYDIEQNLPKMKVNGLSMTPVDGSSDKINVLQLSIGLYVK